MGCRRLRVQKRGAHRHSGEGVCFLPTEKDRGCAESAFPHLCKVSGRAADRRRSTRTKIDKETRKNRVSFAALHIYKKTDENFQKRLAICFYLCYNSIVVKPRPVGQAAKTSPSHGENGSSILPRVTKNAFAIRKCVFLSLHKKHKSPCRARGLVLPSIYCGAMRP